MKTMSHKMVNAYTNLEEKDEKLLNIIENYMQNKYLVEIAVKNILKLYEKNLSLFVKPNLLKKLLTDYLVILHPSTDVSFEFCGRYFFIITKRM